MKRDIHGIFLLDKPLGGSSNHALQKIKHLFNAKKAGHTGSLDPLATGMLPICLGEATKYSQHLLDANKVYEVTAQLGVRTDTGDAEGAIIDRSDERQLSLFTLTALHDVIQKFTGEIQQIPPMHSALKHKGKPLYEYARKGEVIDRPARTVTIYSLELVDVQVPTMTLRVHCSKGTYIRSLIDDMGEALGCGAHVIALHRTFVEPFASHPMMTLEALEASSDRDQYLLPIDAALMAWPQYFLSDKDALRLQQGLPLYLLDHPVGAMRFYDNTHTFLGIGHITPDGEVTHKRLMSTR